LIQVREENDWICFIIALKCLFLIPYSFPSADNVDNQFTPEIYGATVTFTLTNGYTITGRLDMAQMDGLFFKALTSV
jgi:hypothetical protein